MKLFPALLLALLLALLGGIGWQALRAQDGLLWSGSFLALRQADGTVRRLFGPCAVQLADDPHRATALFVPRM